MSTKESKANSKNRPNKPDEKPTVLLLVRHGNTASTGKVLPGRAGGLDLAPDGLAQAEEVAEQLSKIDNVAAIYTSPLARAQQTAEPLARKLGLKAEVSELLFECEFGDWTGRELKELYKLPEWDHIQKTPSTFRFPNGESFMEMVGRMSRFVENVQNKHKGQIVVAFSHADPIKALLCTALGMHLDMFQRLTISTCSVSAISYSTSGPVVLGSNWLKNLSFKVS